MEVGIVGILVIILIVLAISLLRQAGVILEV